MKTTQKKSLRVQEVLRLLRDKPRTIKELCERMKIEYNDASHRAILRDIQDLRDQDYSIEANNKRPQTYSLTREPPPTLRADEALAAHIALRLLFHHTSNPPQSYKNALEKILLTMPTEIQKIAQLSLPNNQGSNEKYFYFEKIARCWTERRVISFDYLAFSTTSQKARKNELEIYFVEVSRSNFEIYVIGRRINHPPYEVRTFMLSLMKGITPLDQHYEIPLDFDPQAFLSDAWGVIGNRESMLVRLRFDASVRRWLENRRFPGVIHHQTDENGHYILTIQIGVNNKGEPQELMPFIRGWGAKVEVLEPQELRQRWLKDAQEVIQRYAGDNHASL
jgi:predicted DNA-binding transcriptional regulator YafY